MAVNPERVREGSHRLVRRQHRVLPRWQWAEQAGQSVAPDVADDIGIAKRPRQALCRLVQQRVRGAQSEGAIESSDFSDID